MSARAGEAKFRCGVIEGYYDEARKHVPKEERARLSARGRKSWPKDPAYLAGYRMGSDRAKEGQDLPPEARIFSWYMGYVLGQ